MHLQEFAFLGSQPLSDLRKVLRCNNDLNMVSIQKNRNAGFIYLEGTFYNDTHDPCACDLSAPIIDFLAKRQQGYQQPQYTQCEGRLPAEEPGKAANFLMLVLPGAQRSICTLHSSARAYMRPAGSLNASSQTAQSLQQRCCTVTERMTAHKRFKEAYNF